MTIPAQRSKRRLPRGTYANIAAGLSDFEEGELCYTRDQNALYVIESGQLINPTTIKTVNQFTGSHVIDLNDTGAIIEINSSSSQSVTIPTDASSNLNIGCIIEIVRIGTGSVTINSQTGVTILSPNSYNSISVRYGRIILRKRSANSWIINGDLA